MNYEKNQLAAAFREFVNKSCSWNPFYRNAIKQYKAIYCINKETQIPILSINISSAALRFALDKDKDKKDVYG